MVLKMSPPQRVLEERHRLDTPSGPIQSSVPYKRHRLVTERAQPVEGRGFLTFADEMEKRGDVSSSRRLGDALARRGAGALQRKRNAYETPRESFARTASILRRAVCLVPPNNTATRT